uniref:Uncharacterized protein n=1 Tax=Abalone asfa-like virus TaxID=2839893 RepID=A0A5K7Y3I0_9VIRU|nr:hypothetical protein [Abalone asfa-like virus]
MKLTGYYCGFLRPNTINFNIVDTDRYYRINLPKNSILSYEEWKVFFEEFWRKKITIEIKLKKYFNKPYYTFISVLDHGPLTS